MVAVASPCSQRISFIYVAYIQVRLAKCYFNIKSAILRYSGSISIHKLLNMHQTDVTLDFKRTKDDLAYHTEDVTQS